MPHATLRPLLRHLGRSADLKDNDLLERFARDRDEAAFRTLVERHGRLVLAVCRRHAGHDAEDAFQATFLLLARKAHGLTRRPGVAGWLAAAARHLARRARRTATRRAAHEAQALPIVRAVPDPSLADLGAVLDAELARLPTDEREVFTVCLLEGLSRTEAAARLGWPEGTVAGRLARARERLRDRLTRRGLTLTAALMAVGLAEAETVPAGLREAVVAAARSAPSVARFTLAAVAVIGIGTVLAIGMGNGQAPPKDPAPAAKPAFGPRVDVNGDPLPERVLARIGHARFRHEAGISKLAVSHEGTTVATLSTSGTVRLWAAATGKLRTSWSVANANYGDTHIGFVGDRLFVDPPGVSVKPHLADGATGKVVWKFGGAPPPGAPRTYDTVRLSADGKQILEVAGLEGTVRVLDRETGKAAFSEKLYDPTRMGRLTQQSALFLPDGKTFLLIIDRGEIVVREYSAATGKVVREFPTGLSQPLATCSPDGRFVAAYQRPDQGKPDTQDTIVVWDRVKNAKVCAVGRPGLHPTCLAFSPDGQTFAVGGQGLDVALLTTADGAEVRRFSVQTGCMSLAFAPDGQTLYTGDFTGRVAKWEVATGKPMPFVPLDMPEVGSSAEFRGGEILTAGDRLGWWDAATGKPLRAMATGPHPAYGRPAVSPDGKRFVYHRRRDPDPGQLVERVLETGTERVLADRIRGGWAGPQFSPDGRRLALAGGFHPGVFVLDAATGKVLHELKDHRAYVDTVLFSPDGTRLVSHANDANGQGDYDIRVWEVATGKLLHKLLPTRGSAFQCAFTPDGRHLVSVGGEPGRPNTKGEAYLWDLATGALVRTWDAHAERVVGVSVSPDGRSALTSGLDRKLRLWELPSGLLRHEFAGHAAYVRWLTFAPDGRRFLACSGDAPCYVWDVYGHLTAGPKPLSAKELATTWADLAGDEPAGFKAIGALIRAGAASDLAGRLKPVTTADAEAVEKWIADLGSDRFAVRERAAANLAPVADQVRLRFRKVLETETSAEVRERVKKLLEVADADTPEWRQQRRAVEALEVMGSREARSLLEALAKGAPGARLTAEAVAAIQRMQ
jgi:RNA polymerase sigma factor (sigma-70 family)